MITRQEFTKPLTEAIRAKAQRIAEVHGLTIEHIRKFKSFRKEDRISTATTSPDVLMRIQTHPASRIDELLPHNWAPPRPGPST